MCVGAIWPAVLGGSDDEILSASIASATQSQTGQFGNLHRWCPPHAFCLPPHWIQLYNGPPPGTWGSAKLVLGHSPLSALPFQQEPLEMTSFYPLPLPSTARALCNLELPRRLFLRSTAQPECQVDARHFTFGFPPLTLVVTTFNLDRFHCIDLDILGPGATETVSCKFDSSTPTPVFHF